MAMPAIIAIPLNTMSARAALPISSSKLILMAT